MFIHKRWFLLLAFFTLWALLLSGCGTLSVAVEPEATSRPAVVEETAADSGSPLPTEQSQPLEPTVALAEPEATATAAPAPALPAAAEAVAFIKEEGIWLWQPGQRARTLTGPQGQIGSLVVSPDAAWVAYTTDDTLWVVSSTGHDARALVTGAAFAGMPVNELVTSVVPYQIEWIPGTSRLLFNTIGLLEQPGLFPNDDLWQVDAQSGEVRQLLEAGQGGSFVLSPDGQQLALTNEEGQIALVNVDGSNRRELLSYERVMTYSEYVFYARPVWAATGSRLLVAIPSPDSLAPAPEPPAVWELFVDGSPARLVGELPPHGSPPGTAPALAPDLDWIAFFSDENENGYDLLVAPVGDTVGEAQTYAQRVTPPFSWAPDGSHFLFAAIGDPLQRYVGAPQSASQRVGSDGGLVVQTEWLAPGRVVYTEEGPDGWNLVAAGLEGESEVIATVPGEPPVFDVAGSR